MWRAGVDTGGTFTDFIAHDPDSGAIATFKSASTPQAPGEALLEALTGAAVPQAAIEHLVHGTTVATNAIIERKGARVAFVTTRGFEDTLFIQRINRPYHYSFDWDKPLPLVHSRRLCFGVDERTLADGSILKPVQRDEAMAVARKLRRAGCDAVAICFLFSYLNPENERAAAEWIRTELPDIAISLSHEVAPIWREFERGNTTLADAYLKPVVAKYVDSLNSKLVGLGNGGAWSVMKSNGGVTAHVAAKDRPVHTVMSGPAGGMIAARHFARLSGYERVVTLDMGGTSADVGLILDGELGHTDSFEIEWGQPVAVPMIDVRSIGAGGGSIAWVDAAGMLHVGPQSAGSAPGPACYGQGGDDPTVTDANLVLGRIDAGRFLGGRMRLSAERAESAILRIGGVLGMPVESAAKAIVDIASDNMANAIQLVTLGEGRDPREFALLAFGGAGGLHAAYVAESCMIGTVLVPPFPGLFSALGLLLADVRVDRAWNRLFRSDYASLRDLLSAIEELKSQVLRELRHEGVRVPARIAATLGMRYLGQDHSNDVLADPEVLARRGLAVLYEEFHRVHELKYGYRLPGEVIEIVEVRVSGVASTAKPVLKPRPGGESGVHGTATVVFQGAERVPCPVVDRAYFPVGSALPGPFLVAEDDGTTLIRPQDRVVRNEHDVLVIEVGLNARG